MNRILCILFFQFYIQYMDTPLHLASADGRESIVNILLKAGASPSAHDKV